MSTEEADQLAALQQLVDADPTCQKFFAEDCGEKDAQLLRFLRAKGDAQDAFEKVTQAWSHPPCLYPTQD